jgi:hypothetical protein
MPNGATESVYATPTGGGRVSFVTPPPSFDAANASPAELELYGVPAEPAKDSPEYPKWKSMVDGGIHFVAPPEQLVEASDAFSPPPPSSLVEHTEGLETGSSPVWGGYVNIVPTHGEHAEPDAYTKATGYYKQPEAAGPECGEQPASATWVGLGGWTANKILGQAGTLDNWFIKNKLYQNEAIIEIEPGELDLLHFSATPGHYMEAETQYLGEGKYHFYIYNYANHTAIAPKGSPTEGEFDGETADYIVEREFGHNLFNFAKVTFQGYTNGKAFQDSPTERVDMENKKGENVRVSNIAKKYEFTAKFKNCERADEQEEKYYEEVYGKLKREKVGTGYPAPKVTTGESSEVAGTTAKLNGTVNPEGDFTMYHFEYGVEADNFEGSSQVEVAGEGVKTVSVSAAVSELHSGTTYYYRLVAESGNGIRDGEERTFKTTGTPPPAPPTVTTEPAVEVRDESATLAASVDPNGADTHYYFEYGPNSTLFERSVPAPPGNDAGAGTSSVHEGVEAPGLLPSKTYYYRVVASNSTGTSYGEEKSFTTPTVWSVQATPNPHGTLESDKLGGVSCWSATACVAVGLYVETLGVAVPLVEDWNGTTWEVESAPTPAGATRSQFESVSCTSATACMAVGYYENGSSVELPLAEQWNGTTWTVTTVPNPEGNESPLLSVSCTSASACTAVGATWARGSGSALAERWNGKAWKIETTATISGTHGNVRFAGVSCAATEACVAVGQYNSSPPTGNEATLAEKWNGKTWTQQTMPNPGDGDYVDLVGISCSSTVACTAVGQGETKALIEHWNGTAWEIRARQIPPAPRWNLGHRPGVSGPCLASRPPPARRLGRMTTNLGFLVRCWASGGTERCGSWRSRLTEPASRPALCLGCRVRRRRLVLPPAIREPSLETTMNRRSLWLRDC